MSTPTPVISALKLPEDLGPRLDAAVMSGKPVVASYVDEAGKPHISFRGTVQRFSDTELAMWARDPQAGLPKAILANPHLALIYGDFNPDTRAFLTFTGRGRIESDEDVRRKVFDGSPELERNRDPERKGVVIVVELDEVSGLYEGQFIKLQRG